MVAADMFRSEPKRDSRMPPLGAGKPNKCVSTCRCSGSRQCLALRRKRNQSKIEVFTALTCLGHVSRRYGFPSVTTDKSTASFSVSHAQSVATAFCLQPSIQVIMLFSCCCCRRVLQCSLLRLFLVAGCMTTGEPAWD